MHVATQKPPGRLSTAEVARHVGIHKDTLLRWLRTGRVREPKRDRHGWRYFSFAEAKAVATFAQTSSEASQAHLVAEPSAPYLARVKAINWDFTDAKTSYLTHGIHPYPAKFIPQIPNTLIQEFSTVGDLVGDIFCGSGTTLVEGLLLKRNVVGIDANPLACLISKAKTTPLLENDKDMLLALAQRAFQFSSEIAVGEQPTLFPSPAFVSQAPRPQDKAIAFWFEPFVVEELAEILSWCRALPTESARNLALVSFSAIVVNVSHQDSDTRYVRRAKGLKSGDTMRRFAQVLTDNTNAAEKFSDILEPNLKSHILEVDLLSTPRVPPMDLVVSSPPYPNAYSYHLYHMTRMVWLGMDQPDFKKREIGSHRKFSSNGKNGATIETFRAEMTKIFSWLKTCVRRDGHACFIVGNSTIRGRTHDNADVLREAADATGWVEVARLNRNMKDTSKAFNPKIGKIKTERIVIFHNRG